MNATIRTFLTVVVVEAVLGALWVTYWLGVTFWLVPTPAGYDTRGLTWSESGQIMTLFTGIPTAIGVVVLFFVARGTVRRASWAPGASSGVQALVILALLWINSLPTLGNLARWGVLALALVALVLPVLPSARGWFGGRVSA